MTIHRDFQYQFILPKKSQWEMSKWCEQQFGRRWEAIGNREGTWCVFWGGKGTPVHYRWYFKNEQDATIFLLRWA
jgi:hypothetical protein